MASISDLLLTIRACKEMIRIIEEDIKGMKKGQTDISLIHGDFYDLKNDVDEYDISAGEIWTGNLYDGAFAEQESTSTGIETAKSSCKTAITELDTCIENAYDEIEKYRKKIRECEEEIRRIQEAQRQEANPAAG